jgi:hypothetical protein
MARTRRLAPDAPATATAPLEKHERAFVAITFEHVVDATPALKFYNAAGEVLMVGLSPDAERIWRKGWK